jgi:uncharacterized membrane protein
MNAQKRRVVQAILYEVFAIILVGPMLSIIFDQSPAFSLGLAFVLSSIALGWNYVFNMIFERWETRRSAGGRSFSRRLLHATGFEGGLVVILLPVMALGLSISILDAFLANLGLLVFFFIYAFVFTWAFDRIFGLPVSAETINQPINNNETNETTG